MKMMRIGWLCLNLLGSIPLQAGWLDRKAEGWAWYEEEEKEVQPLEEERLITPQEQLELEKKELESLLAEALLTPCQENIEQYMEAQKKWVDKAGVFSQSWLLTLLRRPDLDPTAAGFATTHYGRKLQKTWESEEKAQLIAQAAQEYGLFFFYEGQSKTSQAFAQVVKSFADKYQWAVVGISADGVSLKEFPFEADTYLAEKLGISIFPALIAFNPKTQHSVPLAFGLKALDQIENSIFLQLRKR